MKNVKRFDTLKLDKIETLKGTGFLRFNVYAGRTGIQKYLKADGSIITEYRPANEVFSENTLESLRGAPFTNNHPKVMVTTDNAKDLMVGFVGDTVERVKHKDLEYQKVKVTVSDVNTIKDIQNGKLEVSLGYDLELDETPGVFNGVKYDAIQKNITINHLALVDKARGGKDVRIRLDSNEAMLISNDCDINNKNNSNNKNTRKDSCMKVKIGDREFDLDKDVADAVKSLQDKFMKMKKEMDKTNSKKDEVDTDKEKLQAKIDHLEAELEKAKEKENKLDDDAFKKALADRRSLEKIAEKCMDSEKLKKIDDMSNVEIKKEIIKAETPNVNLDDKNEIYIDARFDHIVDSLDKSSESHKNAGKEVVNNRKKSADKAKEDNEDEVLKAKLAAQKRDSELWKENLNEK